jgi:Serine dehydrogenase proteinase
MENKEQVQIKIKQPPVLFSKTQAAIAALSDRLGGPLIAYWNGSRGSVCHNDVVALYDVLGRLGQHETIYLFLKSDGGSGQVSLRLVNLLRQHCQRLVALVPLECASAATMVAIGADRILMGSTAYLTAVDTSLNHALSPVDRHNDSVSVSLNELQRVIRLWREQNGAEAENAYKSLFQYVHPLVIGAVDRAESLSIMLCRDLLAHHIADEAQAERIATTLNSKYPSHSYPILLDEAVKIGLQAERMPADVNAKLLELNSLYSEMGQKATTDFDETRAHSNEIANIWEARGVQVFYQQDKDWFYRAEERRWITLNDNSGWHRIEKAGSRIKRSLVHFS